jgi:hypothetical protein
MLLDDNLRQARKIIQGDESAAARGSLPGHFVEAVPGAIHVKPVSNHGKSLSEIITEFKISLGTSGKLLAIIPYRPLFLELRYATNLLFM